MPRFSALALARAVVLQSAAGDKDAVSYDRRPAWPYRQGVLAAAVRREDAGFRLAIPACWRCRELASRPRMAVGLEQADALMNKRHIKPRI